VAALLAASCARSRTPSGADADAAYDGGEDAAAFDAAIDTGTDGGMDAGVAIPDSGSPEPDAGVCRVPWPEAPESPACPVQDPTEAQRCGEPAALFDGSRCAEATADGCDAEQRAAFGSLAECAVACAAAGECYPIFDNVVTGSADIRVGDICGQLEVSARDRRNSCPFPAVWQIRDDRVRAITGGVDVDEEFRHQLCALTLLPSIWKISCQPLL
jgi:hypothetical protein